MDGKLVRVGTTYIPVTDVDLSAEWYVKNLEAVLSYKDTDKAILNFANQSFFLVKSNENESANFKDKYGNERFSITFEVDGLNSLTVLYKELQQSGVKVGEIEDRGHAGRNFVFYDLDENLFDVWSELSPAYKDK